MRGLCATARFTHSFFQSATKLRLPSAGSLFHVKHGTRKCRKLVFGGMTWLARVPTSLFVEARELPGTDGPAKRSEPSPARDVGCRCPGSVIILARG